MKKVLLSTVMILAFAGVAFADDSLSTGNNDEQMTFLQQRMSNATNQGNSTENNPFWHDGADADRTRDTGGTHSATGSKSDHGGASKSGAHDHAAQ